MRILVATALFVGLLCGTSSAESAVWYRFSFDGNNIVNNQFVNGPDGSTAASVGLFDGARWIEDPDGPFPQVEGFRSFVINEHNDFNDAWDFYVSEGYVIDYISLWGLGGDIQFQGGFDFGPATDWGETYLAEWRDDATGPENWTTGLEFANGEPFWENGNLGMPLTGDLSNFKFTVDFDSESFNGLPIGTTFPTTVWFGAQLTLFDEDGEPDFIHFYQGNMTIDTQVVPEPSSLVAMSGLLLCGGLWYAVRRRRKSPPER